MEDRACRVCGCTEDNACEGGCSWVEEDLCSACADDEKETEKETEEEADAVAPAAQVEAKSEAFTPKTAKEKLEHEFKAFRGSGKEGAVSKPVLDVLLLFCKNENFSIAVLSNPNTISDCIKKIMSGVGNSISDLEVYQRAAAFYFPNAKISFSMFIDTDGLEVPVMEKEIKANIPPRQETQSNIVVKEKENKIEIDLNDLLADL